MSRILVTKRDGLAEEFDLDKIHKVVFWACDGLSGVSASEIELRAKLQITDGTSTADIHETLIKSASELISEDAPNYQYVAARLVNYQLRKEVYGRYEPGTVRELVEKNVRLGVYTDELLTNFDEDDWRKIEKIVKHNRDDLIAFAGMEQWRGKYLVKNRVTAQYYETPQMALVLLSAVGFMSYPKTTRMQYVKEFYDAVSTFDISLPTPIMAGLRTPEKQFSSCVTLAVDDNLDSIGHSAHAIMRYISQKAGLGIDMSPIRAGGDEVAGGRKKHMGLTPYARLMQSATKSCSQGGVRGGSATIHLPFWHFDFEELVVLKNNKGTEFNRVRQMDYSFLFNRMMYQRLTEDGIISFFSPKDVPGLLDAFYADQDEFDRLYVKYEADKSIRRNTLTAVEAFTKYLTERKETGRIYLMNIDHANSHGSFIPKFAPITQSNLCQEITLPTKTMGSRVVQVVSVKKADTVAFLLDALAREDGEVRTVKPFDPSGNSEHVFTGTYDPETEMLFEVEKDAARISLCTLAALNFGKVKSPHDFEAPARLVVRFLDNILSYQGYPITAAELATREYRPLGVGVINLAYFLAKNGLKYDQDALPLLDEYVEAFSYYLIKASVDLAEEMGACEAIDKTRYAQGIVPVDTRKPEVDELVDYVERLDWDGLRVKLRRVGIRNATLMAGMPAETSAQLSNSTNGIEPVRSLVTEKVSKDGVLKQVVPEIGKLKNKYDLLWDQKNPRGYLMVAATLQKWFDQSISVNTSYNPEHYPLGELSMFEMMEDLLLCYRWGIKNLYYFNTMDGAGEDTEAMAKLGEDVPISDAEIEDEICESCVL